jgi:serine/threonine protein kinase
MNEVFLTDTGSKLVINRSGQARIGVGGQGQVYRCQLGNQIMAVKLMQQVDDDKFRALQALESSCGSMATLPRYLLYEVHKSSRGLLVGYAMRYVDVEKSISAARLFNFEEIGRLKRYTWKDAVLAALRLAESVAHLHRHGVVIGDLNPENVVFEQALASNGSKTWRATVLDTDSFQLEAPGGLRFHCPVSRPPYTDPELIGCDFRSTWREVTSDSFSLAVLIYQLLLHDHPYDNAINSAEPDLDVTTKIRRGLYPHGPVPLAGLRPGPYRPAPKEISLSIDHAFRRCFSGQQNLSTSGLRPSADEWGQLLRELYAQVVPCSKNALHHHPRGQACLWCGVDNRSGQPISNFANPAAKPTAARKSSASSAIPHHLNSVPKADAQTLLNRYSGIYQQLLAHHQRRRRLLQLKTEVEDQLLELERILADIMSKGGSPSCLIDQPSLEKRMNSLRHRLGQTLGLGRGAQRRAALFKLIEFADSTAKGISDTVGRIRRRQQDLLQQLKGLGTTLLVHSGRLQDPVAMSTAMLQHVVAQQEERWLNNWLKQQKIRSWQIEGFGEGRMATLESHRLFDGEQLRYHIDRVTDLPGIGKGLQSRLRRHLDQLIKQQRTQLIGRCWQLQLEDCLDPQTMRHVTALEGPLQKIKGQLTHLHQDADDLQKALSSQLQQRDRLLQAFEALL